MISNKSSHVLGFLIKEPFGSLTVEKLLDCPKLTFLTAEIIISKANANV